MSMSFEDYMNQRCEVPECDKRATYRVTHVPESAMISGWTPARIVCDECAAAYRNDAGATTHAMND